MEILYDLEEKLLRMQQLLQAGKAIKAKRLAEELLEEEPGLAEAHMTLGTIYENHLQDFARAATCYALAVRFDESIAIAWYALIRMQYYLSDYVALEHTCERALVHVHVYKFIVYQFHALAQEEQLHFKRAIRLLELAQLYAMQDGDLDTAKKHIQRVKVKMDIKRD